MTRWDCHTAVNPVCPHCGREQPDAWEDLSSADGDTSNVVCGGCYGDFVAVATTTVAWSTATTAERAENREFGPEN